jgi:prophage antirepressor-like protein
MNELSIFSFNTQEIRIADQNGDPWFVLRDLLEAMESKTRPSDAKTNAVESLGDGVVSDYHIVDSLGRTQQVTIVNESAATYLLARSNTEKGRELNRFIHIEVLPTIRKTGSYTAPTAPSKPVLGAPASDFRSIFGVMRLLGLDRNAAGISANQAVIATHGTNLLLLSGQTHLVAEDQHRYYTPTELGKRIGVSGRRFNLLLADIGMQAREGEHWAPTAAAEGFYRIFDTGKKHSTGTPVTQIKWADAVLPLVRPEALDADESA